MSGSLFLVVRLDSKKPLRSESGIVILRRNSVSDSSVFIMIREQERLQF